MRDRHVRALRAIHSSFQSEACAAACRGGRGSWEPATVGADARLWSCPFRLGPGVT